MKWCDYPHSIVQSQQKMTHILWRVVKFQDGTTFQEPNMFPFKHVRSIVYNSGMTAKETSMYQEIMTASKNRDVSVTEREVWMATWPGVTNQSHRGVIGWMPVRTEVVGLAHSWGEYKVGVPPRSARKTGVLGGHLWRVPGVVLCSVTNNNENTNIGGVLQSIVRSNNRRQPGLLRYLYSRRCCDPTHRPGPGPSCWSWERIDFSSAHTKKKEHNFHQLPFY
jgi:hypothetical protein